MRILFFLISFITFSFIHQFVYSDTLEYSKTYGNFQNAASITTGRSEFIFISDVQTNQVFKYSKEGVEIGKFGGTGFGSEGLNSPVSIDASDGLNVYVCDNLNNRITKLDYKLNYITAFDFNVYNRTADNSKKIINPAGVTAISSSDVAIIIKSSEYKAAIINSFSDISIFMGSSFGFDRVGNPSKIVRGKELDTWILDAETSEVVNFSSTGTYVKRLKPPDISKVMLIAYYADNLYLVTDKNVIKYDLKGDKFAAVYPYSIDDKEKITDFALFDNSTFLFLSAKKIYQYNLTKQ